MILKFTCNGYHKKTYEETIYSLEIEVDDDYHEHFKELLQKGKLTASHSNNTIIIALRELSWFRNIIFRHVIEINEKPANIYMVLQEWSDNRFYGNEDFLHTDYDTAKEQYEELIEESKGDGTWIRSEVLDKNGKVKEGFKIESSKETEYGQSLYWKVFDLNNEKNYLIITLSKVEIL